MTPLLSVIVSVYNTKKYLRDCIESILAQTYKNFELILVDDGSTDGSSEICDEYTQLFSNVTVIHKVNGGTVSARKAGLEKALGEYVSFIDSDDWIDDAMYEQMMDKILETNSDVVMCDIQFEDVVFEIQPNYIKEGFLDKKALCEQVYPRMMFDYEYCCPCVNPSMCNKIFRREIIRDIIKNVNEAVTYGEDALCTFPAIFKSENAYVMHKCFYHYRRNGDSVSNRYDESIFNRVVLLEEEFRKQFEEYRFEGESQLYGYVARLSVEFIRSELLLHTNVSLRKRINIIKEYMKIESIQESFINSTSMMCDSKVKMKMNLILKGKFLRLYVLYSFRNLILKIKRSKHEN